MVDFVLQVVNADRPCDRGKMLDEIGSYAEFLKQPLKLEMFVPCDEEGNVIIIDTEHKENPKSWSEDEIKQYSKAKEKVLFEGFEVKGNYLMYYDFMYMMIYELENKTIESIIDEIPNNHLTLIHNALKQIGL